MIPACDLSQAVHVGCKAYLVVSNARMRYRMTSIEDVLRGGCDGHTGIKVECALAWTVSGRAHQPSAAIQGSDGWTGPRHDPRGRHSRGADGFEQPWNAILSLL